MVIESIMGRLAAVTGKLAGAPSLRHSSWADVRHEAFRFYGPKKRALRGGATAERAGGMYRVVVDGRAVYWPDGASVDRLVDMYFEVYDGGNNHSFENGGTMVGPGDVVIDCGACEGFFTMKALESGASKVYAVEPGRAALGCLSRTFEAEIGRGRVSLLPYLIGGENGAVNFSEDPSDPSVSCVADGGAGARAGCREGAVEMLTIDEVCRRHSIGRVDFIKADVEGSEVGLVEGAVETIKRFRPRLAVAVYHGPDNANRVVEILEGLGLGYRIKARGIVSFGGVPRPVMVHCHV